jgi:hypothetical protein
MAVRPRNIRGVYAIPPEETPEGVYETAPIKLPDGSIVYQDQNIFGEPYPEDRNQRNKFDPMYIEEALAPNTARTASLKAARKLDPDFDNFIAKETNAVSFSPFYTQGRSSGLDAVSLAQDIYLKEHGFTKGGLRAARASLVGMPGMTQSKVTRLL